MSRHRLTDAQWDLISDLFPPAAKTGRPPTDRRTVVDAILWIMRTGAPWRDLPEDEYVPWETVYGLFNTWNGNGTLDKILRRLQVRVIDSGELDDELWNIDGTIIRAHRCAGGGGKKGIRRNLLITH